MECSLSLKKPGLIAFFEKKRIQELWFTVTLQFIQRKNLTKSWELNIYFELTSAFMSVINFYFKITHFGKKIAKVGNDISNPKYHVFAIYFFVWEGTFYVVARTKQ